MWQSQPMAVDSRTVRNGLEYPVIDIDGHLVEHLPEVVPFVRPHLDAALFDRWVRGDFAHLFTVTGATNAERVPTRVPQAGWWGAPTANTLDRATAMLPGLLCERMEELGFDLTVLYPTVGFGIAGVADDDLRRGLCAGWNEYLAAAVEPYRHRIRVAGVIPMHTPDEAVAELDHCHTLGIDVVGLPHAVMRRVDRPLSDVVAFTWPGSSHWLDTYGLDSAFDYDVVWQRCRELKLPVTFHGGLAFDNRHMQSPSNFVWNHLGLHASMMSQVARSLVLGGVTRRFGDLSFAFLECGVAWAASLACDLIEHWERRSVEGLTATDPERLDVAQLTELFARYGRATDGLERLASPSGPPVDERDDFVHTGASNGDELVAQLAESCFFGCEADDAMVGTAFSSALPNGVRLQAALSSDLGHWDVDGIANVLLHAWRHVERGTLSERDFRDFVFVNPARLYLRANPDFFAGTSVEPHLRSLNDFAA
jgi:predicted TIM-barrel fold metal-dependent hydrolase